MFSVLLLKHCFDGFLSREVPWALSKYEIAPLHIYLLTPCQQINDPGGQAVRARKLGPFTIIFEKVKFTKVVRRRRPFPSPRLVAITSTSKIMPVSHIAQVVWPAVYVAVSSIGLDSARVRVLVRDSRHVLLQLVSCNVGQLQSSFRWNHPSSRRSNLQPRLESPFFETGQSSSPLVQSEAANLLDVGPQSPPCL